MINIILAPSQANKNLKVLDLVASLHQHCEDGCIVTPALMRVAERKQNEEKANSEFCFLSPSEFINNSLLSSASPLDSYARLSGRHILVDADSTFFGDDDNLEE